MGKKDRLSAKPVLKVVEKTAFVTKTVEIPEELYGEAEALMVQRGLTLSEAVRLYLRALVLSSKKGRPLSLMDEMPFGKYKGEEIGVVLRGDPEYIKWLVDNSSNFSLQPEANRELVRIIAPNEEE